MAALKWHSGLQWDSCHAAVREAGLSVRKGEHFGVRTLIRTPENSSGKCYFNLVLFRNVHIHKALLSHISFFFSPSCWIHDLFKSADIS